MKQFITRGIVMTCGVDAEIRRGDLSHLDLLPLVHRHFENDGDECEDDKRLNAEAIKHQDGRVFSTFNNVKGKRIWIITDGLHLADDVTYGGEYPHTTILFPEEY